MTIEEAVCARLLAISPVTALVGSRVYLQLLPQNGILPAIRVQQISEATESHHRGVNNLRRTRVQVDVFAAVSSGVDPYSTAMAIAEAIDGDWLTGNPPSGLSGWQGTAGGSPPTIAVQFVDRVERRPMFEADELKQVRIRQDYMIQWSRV